MRPSAWPRSRCGSSCSCTAPGLPWRHCPWSWGWASCSATVGLAAVALWLELFLHSTWAAVAALALVVVLIIYLVGHRRRTGHTIAPTGTGDEGENGEDASRSEMPASRP